VVSSGDPEGAFFCVQLNVEPPEVVEGFFQVGDEAIAPLRFDDDVINIDFEVVPYLPLEAELHRPLISAPCILYPERHLHVVEIVEGVMNVVVGWSASARGI
jgi:hypothetical protein